MAALVRNEHITTEISNQEARERYRLETSHSFTLFSKGELSEETIGKVCEAIVEWTIVMGAMPLRNAKFNANLGCRVAGQMFSYLRADAEYIFFTRMAQRFLKADAELRSLMDQHKVIEFELSGRNQFFNDYSLYQR